jgi:glucose dehydrogenase
MLSKLRVATSLLALAVAVGGLAGVAKANDELIKMQADPNQWVMPLGNYASQRYSPLDQINTSNVKNLQVAWTFSTGVLRGHEGGPLVIGDVMYIHRIGGSIGPKTPRRSIG